MAYLAQKTRASQLTIGGTDYTSSLISFQVSDTSAYKNGLIITTGQVVLGQRPGQADIQDYDRNAFRRGASVVLDITEPGSTPYRHPRGQLYVISVSYSVETEQLIVEVGCRLALASLTDNASTILSLVPIPLDPAQQTVQNVGASFASAGMILYQNNQGNYVSRKFFGNDDDSGIDAGEWVSVLGETALKVEPLSGGKAIPDKINLSYQVPQGVIATDNTGQVDTVTEVSNYFYAYPVTVFTRNPPEDSGIGDSVDIPPPGDGSLGGCGNTLEPPDTPANVDQNVSLATQLAIACDPEWTTDSVRVYLPATRTATSTTTYGGPAGQVSRIRQEVYGPAVEMQPQYFADKYAYCTTTYGYNCNPGGNCSYYGTYNILQSYSETINEYDEFGNLRKSIQDNYVTKLSAAVTEDWRSGIIAGRPQDFQNNFDSQYSDLYRESRVVNEYSTEDQANIQLTTTFQSMTSRGVGVTEGQNLDALSGVVTSVRRKSVTNIPNDLRPDIVNSPTTSTEEYETLLLIADSLFQSPPTEAGEYILDESIPVPLLSTSQSQVDTWVNDYSNYLVRFTKGDLYGIRIAESMRSEIVTNWYPGMPFRYADTVNNTIAALRMDACAWGVTQEESIVVTNGIWNGFSSGTLSVGNNLTGNSTPVLGGSPTAPPAVDPPPSITNDVVGQSFAFEIDVDLWLTADVLTYGADGVIPINPTDLTADVEQAIVPYVSGIIVATGDLLAPTGTGSIPLEFLGSLVVDNATVIDADVFAA